LSKLWFRVEEAIADPSVSSDKEELAHYVEQSVLLNGQVFNALNYSRRVMS